MCCVIDFKAQFTLKIEQRAATEGVGCAKALDKAYALVFMSQNY